MYVKEKNFPILNLAKDEQNNFIGHFCDNGMIKPFDKPTNNIFDIFLNLSDYFPEWKDQGFNCYVKKENDSKIMIQVKTKEMHKEDIPELIKNNALKLYPELSSQFELYCKERLKTIEYLYVIVKYTDKEDRCAINKNGTLIKLTDISGFLKKYPYYPDIKYVPKKMLYYEDLIKKSINKKQDCGLNLFLRETTTLTDDKILEFQDDFRNNINEFVFERNNIKHLTCLINYIKEKNPMDAIHNLIGLLYGANECEYNKEKNIFIKNTSNQLLKYGIIMREYLNNLIISDKDCINELINTDFISNEKREALIQENINLLQYLNDKFQQTININLITTYINKDLNNLKYINIDNLLDKNRDYAISIINDFLQKPRKIDNIKFIDTLLNTYHEYVSDYTFGICLNNTPINKLSNTFSLKPEKQFIPLIINKFNDYRIVSNDESMKNNFINLIKTFNNHNYNYDVIFEPLTETEEVNIIFIDKTTGEKINKLQEPELSRIIKQNNQIKENTKEVIKENVKTITKNETKENKEEQQTQNKFETQRRKPKKVQTYEFDDDLFNEVASETEIINQEQINTKNIVKKETVNNDVSKTKDELDMIKYDDIKDLDGRDFWKAIGEEDQVPPEYFEPNNFMTKFKKEQIKSDEKSEEIRNLRKNNFIFKGNKDLPESKISEECFTRFIANYLDNGIIDDSLLESNNNFVKTVVDFDIISMPYKLNYINNEQINCTGLEILVKCNDGSNETLSNIEPLNKIANKNEPYIIIEYENIKKEIPITIEDKKPISLTITKLPNKLDYIQNEDIDLSGIEVVVKYNDLSEETVTNFDYELTDKSIAIKYCDLMDTFNINITPQKIVSLKIVRSPDKVNYFENEKIDLSGLIVEAIYNNKKREKITNYETNISNARVTITYENVSASFSLNITPIKVIKLELITNPYKTEYFKGENFNPDGLILRAYFNNKTYTDLTNIKDTPKIYKRSVSITYKNTTIDIPIKILERKVDKIVLGTPPTKTIYEKNEVFDPTGIEILKEYNDKTTEKVLSFDYTPKCALTPEDKKITIYYDVFTLEIPITVRGALFKSKKKQPKNSPFSLIKEDINEKQTTEENLKEKDKKEVTKEQKSQLENTRAETTKKSPSLKKNKVNKFKIGSNKEKVSASKENTEKNIGKIEEKGPFSRLSSDKSYILNNEDGNQESKEKVLEKLQKNESLTQEELKDLPLNDIINNIIL